MNKIRFYTLPLTLALSCVFNQGIAQPSGYIPVTDAILQSPADQDWLMWRRTLNDWCYSPLDQINTGNVSDIEMAWSLPLNEGSVQEGTPLVYD